MSSSDRGGGEKKEEGYWWGGQKGGDATVKSGIQVLPVLKRNRRSVRDRPPERTEPATMTFEEKGRKGFGDGRRGSACQDRQKKKSLDRRGGCRTEKERKNSFGECANSKKKTVVPA